VNVSRTALASALGAVAHSNAQQARWEYDSVKCARLDAKVELCEELAAALGLHNLPAYRQAREGL
jgi:hypothetical protein